MKYILIAVFMAVLFLSCGTNRETVLDRVVTVHREIFLEIPSVSRLCEELGLEGDSVFVNKTFLYVET